MKKSNWFAISLVVLAVFNLIAFTAPFNKTSTFWIGYIFGTIAVLPHLLVSQKTLNAGKELKSHFYGWPLMIVASIYMTVQIILSLLFMLASSIDAWISLIISALCLAICMIGMISGEGAKEIIEKTDVKVNEKVFFIKSLESDIHLLSASCNDAATKKNIVALEDAIRFSDPMSSDMLSDIECEIAESCKTIKTLVRDGQFSLANRECCRAMNLLATRNEKCRLLK